MTMVQVTRGRQSYVSIRSGVAINGSGEPEGSRERGSSD